MLFNISMLSFLSMELLVPKPKENHLCWDKRTLVALAGETEG